METHDNSGSYETRKWRKTAQKSGAKTGASLPRGITSGCRKGRPRPFFVRYGPQRTIESFASEEERNDRIKELLAIRESEGKNALSYSRRDWEEFLAWRKAKRRDRLTVAQAIKRYMELRVQEGLKPKTDTYSHLKKHLEQRLASELGAIRLDLLTKEDLRKWLAGLVSPRSGLPMSPTTVKNHRKDLNVFLERCVAEEWIDKNPCRAVKVPRIDEEPKTPLTPRQVFDLLSNNRNEPVMGRIALELFGAMRYSTAGRATWANVDLEAKGLSMPGAVHKSGKAKYRQGHPEVLWKWLNFVPKEALDPISISNYGHQKALAFARARVKNEGNSLRESFCAYHLALHGSYQSTGYLMQHTRASTTMIYEGIAKKKDAQLVFAMGPEEVSAQTFEQFVQTHQSHE